MKVVLFRESEDPNKDRLSLKPATVVHIPVVRTKALNPKLPKRGYDFLLLTSQKTVRYLKEVPEVKDILCIGTKTQKAFQNKFGRTSKTLLKSNSKGVLRFFRKQSPSDIIFPRSALGDPQLVKVLRDQGHRVCVRHLYTTELKSSKKKLRQLVAHKGPIYFFITSPSIAWALFRQLPLEQIRKKKDIVWVSIGPSTSQALRSKLGKNFLEAGETSLEGMLRAVKAWHRSCSSNS